MKNGIIYILSWTSGHFYVGQTMYPTRRKMCHLNTMKKGTHKNARVQAVYNLHGLPTFTVVDRLPREKLTDREQFFLDIFFKNKDCLNLNDKAECPPSRPLSQEAKDKISKALTGRKRSAQAIANAAASKIGIPLSAEHIETLRANHPAKKKVMQYSLEGLLVNVFRSIHEAARQVGGSASNISKCVNGHIGSAYGYRWKIVFKKPQKSVTITKKEETQ